MMMADNKSAVGWVKKEEEERRRAGGGADEVATNVGVGRGMVFPGKHVPGAEIKLPDGITRWKEEDNPKFLQIESPGTPWQVQ